MGGSWGLVYGLVYSLPLQVIPNLLPHCTIVHLEMINVYVALNRWKKELKGRTVVIYCDNMAVVSTLSSGHSWDKFLGTVARNICLFTAFYDIESLLHVSGKENGSADSLSQWYGRGLSGDVVYNLLCFQWCDVDNEILSMNNTI